ncbi:hypothetical protein G6F37_012897 [Rhizopus arrhizus]|nr:hypothetical protein G6F37_012897 [Rhizopus arrhizus]KAG1141754.1 hypothetical protein G6F38_008208 [Rhizopus arrhizus]
MDYPTYIAIRHYLDKKKYPLGMDLEKDKRKFRKKAKKYTILSGKLYSRVNPKQENPLELLHEGNLPEVIKQIHQEGHLGINNTWNRVKLQYTAPKLFEAVREVIKHCETCQFRVKKPRKRTVPGKPISVPSRPFYMVGCDAVGPVIESNRGNKMILVAVDYLTKWPIARAVKDITEVTTGEFIFQEIVQLYGVPNYLLTDRGSNFTSAYVRACLKQMNCRHLTTSAFRPQTNGLCERTNQTLVQTIAKLLRDYGEKKDWDLMIPAALMALRTMKNDATGFTPGMLLYGYDIRTPGNWPPARQDYVEGELQQEIDRRVEEIDTVLKDYRTNAKKKQKQRYDKTVHFQKRYKIGEQVLMKDHYPPDKFSDRWIGPMTVVKVNESGTYHLIGPNKRRLGGAVNGDFLIPYHCKNSMVSDVTKKRSEELFNAWIERKSGRIPEVEF